MDQFIKLECLVWMDSLKDKWFKVSFTMASSSLSKDTFEWVDSAME